MGTAMSGGGGQWSALAAALVIWTLAEVGALPARADRVDAGRRGTDSSTSETPGESNADTLDAIGESLAGERLGLDEREVDALAERFAQSAGSGGTLRPWFVDLDLMEGHRSAHRVSMGWRDFFRLTARRDGERVGGYAAIAGAGPLRHLVVGGLRPRLAENTVLGARYTPFDPPGAAAKDLAYLGLNASPAAAVWDPTIGAFSRWSVGRQEIGIAGWQSGEEAGSAAQAGWASLCRHSRFGEFGVAGGIRRKGDGLPWEFGGASVYGGRQFGTGAISAEAAAVGGEVLFAVRGALTARAEWRMELYDGSVPRGVTANVIDPEDAGRRQWGAAVHRLERVRGVATRVSLYTGARRYGETSRSRSRIEAVGRGRTSGGAWELSARYTDELESIAPAGPLAGEMERTARKEGQIRVSWESAGESLLRQYYRLSVSRGGRTGAVGSMGWGFGRSRLDVRLLCTCYSLATGSSGHVLRPGLGGYETLNLVSGSGTDLCVRVRLTAFRGLRLAAYAGQPRRGQVRWYVSVGGSI